MVKGVKRRKKTIIFYEMKDGKVINRFVEDGYESTSEAVNRTEREHKESERERLSNKLNPHGRKVLVKLNDFVDALKAAGVDMPYFPHKAQMAVLKYARKIQGLAGRGKRETNKPVDVV